MLYYDVESMHFITGELLHKLFLSIKISQHYSPSSSDLVISNFHILPTFDKFTSPMWLLSPKIWWVLRQIFPSDNCRKIEAPNAQLRSYTELLCIKSLIFQSSSRRGSNCFNLSSKEKKINYIYNLQKKGYTISALRNTYDIQQTPHLAHIVIAYNS